MKYCFFRFDAYPDIGTGHFIRCKVLADYLIERGFSNVFLISNKSIKTVKSHKLKYHVINNECELDDIINICNRYKSSKILITDSDNNLYYTSKFQKQIMKNGIYLMTITMRSNTYFYSNIVLNQNIIALRQKYSHEDYTKLLLGPDYVLLNKQFIENTTPRTNILNAQSRLLINFGGADVLNLTFKVYEKVQELHDVVSKINIVIGKLYKPIEVLKRSIERNNHIIPVELFINTNEMSTIMYNSDFAITSGGLTVWELLYLNIPNAIISSSERESITAQELKRRQCIEYFGHKVIPENFQDRMKNFISNKSTLLNSENASSIKIDGKGIERVYNEINSLFK